MEIDKLKAEISDLINLAEKRRVNKLSLSEKILSSKFFSKIENSYADIKEYQSALENKYIFLLNNMINFDQIRKKELNEYRERENREKRKLDKKIIDLQSKVDNLSKNQQNFKNFKYDTNINETNIQAIDKIQNINKNLNTQITLLASRIKNQEQEIILKQQKIDKIYKNIGELENKKFLDPQILEREFRHSTHKKIFKKIYEYLKGREDLESDLKELERYVKTREKGIHNYKKQHVSASRALDREKLHSKNLINEISNSSETFKIQQDIIEDFRKELGLSTQNFNHIFKEKNFEKDKFF